MSKISPLFFAVIFLLALCSGSVIAKTSFNNDAALKDQKQAAVYFDINQKDGDMLLFRLELLERTIEEMVNAGLEVTGVLGFRGNASRFITKDAHYVLDEDAENKMKIQALLKSFAGKGLKIEQCSIAADILEIPYEDFMPEVKIVGNGYISLIGYQAQGYSIVPMD